MASHGVKKLELNDDQKAEMRKKLEEKSKKYSQLMNALFKIKEKKEFDVSDLELAAKGVKIEPNLGHVWNLRKTILMSLKNTMPSNDIDALFDKELKLSEECIEINPKSYCTWNHRYFVLNEKPTKDFNIEFELLSTLLKMDERNFHAWNYRRLVLNLCPDRWEKELAFTDEKINTNFGNFSAWHHRSYTINNHYPHLLNDRSFIKKEVDFLNNAFYTDPSDMSCWLYFKWLIYFLPADSKMPLICAASCKNKPDATSSILMITILFFQKNGESEIKVSLEGKDVAFKSPWKVFESDNRLTTLISEVVANPQCKELQVAYRSSSITLPMHSTFSCVFKPNLKCFGYSSRFPDIFNDEIKLLIELDQGEKTNKNVILHLIHLMSSIDAKLHLTKIDECFERLSSIDSIRKEYYLNLKSKIHEMAIIQSVTEKTVVFFSSFTLDLQSHISNVQFRPLVAHSTNILSSNDLNEIAKPKNWDSIINQ